PPAEPADNSSCQSLDERAVDAWLGRIGAEHLLVPGAGHARPHTLTSGWSLDRPRGLSEHLVHFVIRGGCTVVAGRDRWDLAAGGVVWIRPRTPFILRAADDEQTVVHRFLLAGDPAADACLGPAMCVPGAWDLRGTFDLLMAETQSTRPYRDERIRGLLLVLFTSLLRRAEWRPTSGLLSSSARYALESYTDRNIHARPTTSDLARVAGLSPDYFTRVFRKTYGMPPREWIVRRRIQRATVLLDNGDRTVAQVAAALGYSDPFLFSRQFKAVMGLPPQSYRAR
ncbi:AraC family transcriptional regulator, partial [Streptomyces sp. ADI96-02]|uniref:helix-turn-helix domain-containing protein n=1 Tax=Streptomyces sp. ADI96-02 TaxID=1522760 RepID=UPI0013DE6689